MRPNLIHPVPIDYEQVSTSTTTFDPDLEEPIGSVEHVTPVRLSGQVQWFRSRQLFVDRSGRQFEASGYALFRYADLETLGVSLADNDRFTRLGHERGRWWIVGLEPLGHYPDQGGATLLKAHFNDREPAKAPT
jgi:hypothetical protein